MENQNNTIYNIINSGDNPDIPFKSDHFKNVLISELNYQDIYLKLTQSKQEKIKVKEVIIESQIDFIKSVKQLKTVFEAELYNMTQKMNDIYNRELLKIKSLHHESVAGSYLMKMIGLLQNEHLCLIIKDGSMWMYKYYNPLFPVSEGYDHDGKELLFNEPVCHLKGIYLNILHPQITSGSIMIASEKQHPNVRAAGFSEACPGTLSKREIPIDKPEELIALMKEISTVYEKVHLQSAYYTPKTSYKLTEPTETWTT